MPYTKWSSPKWFTDLINNLRPQRKTFLGKTGLLAASNACPRRHAQRTRLCGGQRWTSDGAIVSLHVFQDIQKFVANVTTHPKNKGGFTLTDIERATYSRTAYSRTAYSRTAYSRTTYSRTTYSRATYSKALYSRATYRRAARLQ